MNVTHDNRLQLLQAHNDLKHILQNIWDCHDIWMSDVGKLERIQCDLHRIFKFVPREDEDGHRMHYADWVLHEGEEDED